MEVGGWVQVSLGCCCCWIIVPNLPETSRPPTDILEWYTMCILTVHTLLTVVGYYDLSVLSMSVWMGCELYPFFGGFFGIF